MEANIHGQYVGVSIGSQIILIEFVFASAH